MLCSFTSYKHATVTQVALCTYVVSPDQHWGVIARRIAHADHLLTPEDVIKVIEDVLTTPSVKSWIGRTTRAFVDKLDVCHDWRNHLPGVHVGLAGGMLEDTKSNHFYFFVARRGVLSAQTVQCLILLLCFVL